MKLKNLLLFATAGMFAFTSCNNDDTIAGGGNGERESGNLILKIETGGLSRAVADDNVTNNTVTPFEDGAIFFVKQGGGIERYVTISNTVIGAIPASDLTTGVVFDNVDASAKEVVVVGNFTNFNNSYTNISEIETLITDLSEQYDGEGGIKKVTLFGRANITEVVTGSGTPADGVANYESYPVIAPIASRFEIVKMIYTDLTGASAAENEFIQLKGIYLNNIYYSMGITGQNHGGFFNYGTTIADYFRVALGGQYANAWHPFIFDDGWDGTNTVAYNFRNGGSIDEYVLQPDGHSSTTPKVWAYNFFPHPTSTAHIVFHFSNVWIEDENTPGTYILRPNGAGGPAGECYLTARNYKTIANPGAQITIEQGNVYRITDLAFDTDDFEETPEENKDKDIDVFVKVEVMKWKVNEVQVVW